VVEIAPVRVAQWATFFGARGAAPKEGRAKTRVNWILRQLRDAPPDLRISVHSQRTRAITSVMIRHAAERPEELLLSEDKRREPSAVTLALSRDMGIKKGKGRGLFVTETMDQVLDFSGDVLQGINNWTPSRPETPTATGRRGARTRDRAQHMAFKLRRRATPTCVARIPRSTPNVHIDIDLLLPCRLVFVDPEKSSQPQHTPKHPKNRAPTLSSRSRIPQQGPHAPRRAAPSDPTVMSHESNPIRSAAAC
jgi:hypothetical protein